MNSDAEPAKHNPIGEDAKGEPTQAGQSNPNVPIAARVSAASPSEPHYEIICKSEKGFWDKFKDVAEIIGIVLLAVYTLYTIKMYCANKIAADAAKSAADTAASALKESQRFNRAAIDNFHAEERAWIGIEEATPVSLANFPGGKDLAVTFSLRNYGRSTAQNVRIFPQLGAIIPSKVLSGRVRCDDSSAKNYDGIAIFPGQPATAIDESVKVSSSDMESFINSIKRKNPASGRNLILAVTGCVEYTDSPLEKQPHHTSFYYFLMRTDGKFITPETEPLSGGSLTLKSNPVHDGKTN